MTELRSQISPMPLERSLRALRGCAGDIQADLRKETVDSLPDDVRTAIFNAAESLNNTMNLLVYAEGLCKNYESVEVSNDSR